MDDAIDHEPVLGFAADGVDRSSMVYPTTLASNKFITYNITEPVNFLNDTYLRDDRQLESVSIEVTTTVPTSDQLLWSRTLQTSLGINFSSTTNGLTTRYTFSANISDELDWEVFLMSFNFIQNETRAADRNAGRRTIYIMAHDRNNVAMVTVIIDVQPLPPVVIITVQNTTFTEGQDFFLLRNRFPVAVIQDEDALFVSLTVALR